VFQNVCYSPLAYEHGTDRVLQNVGI
jgi:hypothetical protein